MMLAAMQEMVAEVRSMRDEIINKKQKTRHRLKGAGLGQRLR